MFVKSTVTSKKYTIHVIDGEYPVEIKEDGKHLGYCLTKEQAEALVWAFERPFQAACDA